MDLTNVQLGEVLKIQQVKNPEAALAAQSYPTSGNYIDVRGLHKFAFLIGIGAIDSATTFQVQQSKGASGSPKDITGAVKVAGTGTDGKWSLIEVEVDHLDTNNDYTHVSLAVSGPSGNDYGSIYFIGVGSGKYPVTQGSDHDADVVVAG